MAIRKVESLTLIAAFAIFVSLLMMSIHQAQISAQKESSQNNLRQIAIGIHNFEAAFKSMPEGCDQEAKHGWTTSLFPFTEASPWYSHIDFDVPWEHPLNRHQFSIDATRHHCPSHKDSFTTDGFSLTSYHANPAVLYRGSRVNFKELTAGLSNVWLAGEVHGNQTPFGYPFNWRELNQTLNQGPNSFGGWADGSTFVFVDSSVKFIANDIDQSVLNRMATAFPLPEKSQFEVPNRQFNLTSKPPRQPILFLGRERQNSKGGPPYSSVWLTADGRPEFIDFAYGLVKVESTIGKYPNAKTLRAAYPRDSEELDWICSLQELEVLCLMDQFDHPKIPKRARIELDDLIQGLQKLPRLKFLKLVANEQELTKIRKALPNCEVVPSTHRSPTAGLDE